MRDLRPWALGNGEAEEALSDSHRIHLRQSIHQELLNNEMMSSYLFVCSLFFKFLLDVVYCQGKLVSADYVVSKAVPFFYQMHSFWNYLFSSNLCDCSNLTTTWFG